MTMVEHRAIGRLLAAIVILGAPLAMVRASGDGQESTPPSTENSISTAAPGQPAAAGSPTVVREYKAELDPIGPFILRDLEGRLWSERDFRGKVLIVVEWAAWCGPCISEFPQVQKLYDSLRNDPSIGLTSFDLDEDPATIGDFLKEFRKEYSFPVLFGWSRYRINFLPCTWIVDRDGYIREVVRGGGPGWLERVRALVDAVKRKPPVASLPPEVRDAKRQQNARDGEMTR